MQLKQDQNKNIRTIRRALASATCTLLGTSATDAMAFGTDTPWEFDSALLYYSETDRVTVIEPVISAKKELKDDEFLSLRIVYDALSGSSANGAVPMPFRQTFTNPSGKGTYQTPANETPLDSTFHDSRVALSAEWEKPINRELKGLYGANLSKEYDYVSLGGSANFTLDTNNKNTTYSAGAAVNYDVVSPVGEIPVGMGEMPDYEGGITKETDGKSDSKTIVDFLLGVTQILDRKSLLQLNYTLSTKQGYLTDPYKVLSVLDDNTGEIINPGPNDGYSYRHEARPDNRLSQTIYAKYVHQFGEDVINVSYRYFWDDWGVTSHTVDLLYRFELGGGHYLQPHARYYQQTEADFYRPYLLDSQDETITEASADYRLADLTTKTLGLLYGFEIDKSHEFTIRAELMNQYVGEPSKFGALNNQDLSTDLDVYIVQAGYRFTW